MTIQETNLQVIHGEKSADLQAFQNKYEVLKEMEREQPEWDRFIEQFSGGYHVQSCSWAELKSTMGWECLRISLNRGGQIRIGAQMLFKTVPYLGRVGYITKAPLYQGMDSDLCEFFLNELEKSVKSLKIQYLLIQPAFECEALDNQLRIKGFSPSTYHVAPTATLLIDLTNSEKQILSHMKRKKRQNIWRAMRSDLVIREGTNADLPGFYDLLRITSERGNFSIYPEEYFHKVWEVFNRFDAIKLLLAENGDELVSAFLMISFGDTVCCKYSGWSGHYAKSRPNELLEWAAIRWAKTQGYRYYDFEGIDKGCALAVIEGRKIPDCKLYSPSRFKLDFGGMVTIAPNAYEYISNPVLHGLYRLISPLIERTELLQKAMHRFKILAT